MINLLLTEQKNELRAARRNVVLLRYNFLGIVAILFIAGIFGVGFGITTYEQSQAKSELKDYEHTAQQFAPVKKQAEEFEKNLDTASKILANEVVFSDLIIDITRVLPSSVILSNLNVSAESLDSIMTISARTKTYENALELKAALEESDLFKDASIIDVRRQDASDEDRIAREYPFVANLNATMVKETAIRAGGR